MRLVDRVLNRGYRLRRRLTDIVSDKGVVSFTFDDFPASALGVGGAILEEAGWRGTYYACGGLLGTGSGPGAFATSDVLEDCLARGHELANHTLTHCNCIQAEARQIRAEVVENEAVLKSASRNLAFPFGAANIREQRLVRRLVTTARGVQHGVNGRASDRLNLLANPIYSAAGLDPLYRQIKQAADQRGWLIFYTHEVTEQPTQFGCTPADLRALVAAVAASGMEVLTVEQARLRFGLGTEVA